MASSPSLAPAMPRPRRLDLPGIPQHVIQRGNDRGACFFWEADHARYLGLLRELAAREGCAVHAYVLMTNHVHLLLTPAVSGAIARLMQSLGRRYVRYVNDNYERTGTLWEGRYKACPVESGRHLLHCHRYIELNPLRAGMVADPADYRWSSHRFSAQGVPDPLLTPHPEYLALGSDPEERQRVYRQWAIATVKPDELTAIREHTRRQHAYGTDDFRARIEATLGRSAGPQKIGRPKKIAAA
jgi:putative transposase